MQPNRPYDDFERAKSHVLRYLIAMMMMFFAAIACRPPLEIQYAGYDWCVIALKP